MVKSFKNRYLKPLLRFIAPFIIGLISRLIYLSCKNNFFITKDIQDSNFIASLWHGNFLMAPFLFEKINQNDRKIALITSGHGDGDLVERYFNYFNFKAIRGSSNKGGAKVIIQALKKLKEGYDLGITPDGPKGPYKSIKDGVILIAIKSGKPVCPCIVESSCAWRLKTWDKFSIPKPFSTINYYIKDAIYFDKHIDFNTAKEILQKHMEAI